MRVLSLQDGSWSGHQLQEVAEVIQKIQQDRLTWVRAGGLEPGLIARLGDAFGLHPLTIEDVQTSRQRPKVEDYADMTFVVLRVPRYDEEGLHWVQVGLFLGVDFLVTASAVPLPELDELEARILAQGLAGGDQPDLLLHQAVDRIVDAWFPYLDELEDTIETIEDAVIGSPTQDRLHAIREIKAVVSRTRKVSSPMREAMQSLERVEHPHIRPETRLYLRDVSDHMMRIAERLDHVKEMALIAQESWNASLANQQNQVMKRLTVVAALLLFPALIAGLGGMNFERSFPAWNFWVVTVSILALIFAGLGVAAWRRWL